MDLHLNGRTALITGGSRGIGLGVARLLAAEGCNLHLAALGVANLEKASKEITAEYPVAVSLHPTDLSKAENAIKLVRACGPIDILVNNAGAIPMGAFTDTEDQSWREGWDLKVFGYLNVTREVYREMCKNKKGVIVNVVGSSGERPLPGAISGSMANASLMAMSRALGVESVDHGVRVVAVNPGSTKTDRQVTRWKALAEKKFGDEKRWSELTAAFPFGRLAAVDEIASTIVFLCSDRSSYTSGTVITVDGGASWRK